MEKKNKKENDPFAHLDIERISAVSSTDCTGLIPSQPQTDAELDSYRELYDFDAKKDS